MGFPTFLVCPSADNLAQRSWDGVQVFFFSVSTIAGLDLPCICRVVAAANNCWKLNLVQVRSPMLEALVIYGQSQLLASLFLCNVDINMLGRLLVV